MPRLALSTVHLAVREYWTAAAALIGLCILGELFCFTFHPRPTPVGSDTASLDSLFAPDSGAGVSHTAYIPRGSFRSLKGLKVSLARYLYHLRASSWTGPARRDGAFSAFSAQKPPRSRRNSPHTATDIQYGNVASQPT